jgi:hypothetical protein
MGRPRWIIDLDPDFPGSALVRERVKSAIVVSRSEVIRGEWPSPGGPVVGYGTMHTMTRMRRVPNLGNAVFDDYAKLRCSSYYRRIYDLLGRVAVLVPFRALPTLPLERMIGPRVFVRSDSNYKLFPARLLDVTEVAAWLATYREHADELVVVSEPMEIDAEYRCFCREGRFICGSSYPHPPYQAVPENVRRFAASAAQRMLTEGVSCVTVDVAVHGDTLRVVELGGVNSWGVYGADLDAFIAMMEAEALLLSESS